MVKREKLRRSAGNDMRDIQCLKKIGVRFDRQVVYVLL